MKGIDLIVKILSQGRILTNKFGLFARILVCLSEFCRKSVLHIRVKKEKEIGVGGGDEVEVEVEAEVEVEVEVDVEVVRSRTPQAEFIRE